MHSLKILLRRLKLPPVLIRNYREWIPLGLLLIACGFAWGFLELADEVLEGDVDSMDRRILLALRSASDPNDPLGPRWVEEMGRDLTALGGFVVLTTLTLSTVVFVWYLVNRSTAVGILIAVLGAVAISSLLKAAIGRPRPDLVSHGSHVYSHSFPSGHSMLSAATYLTLGMMLARLISKRGLKVLSIALAIMITIAVGISRVYLGVHWPSDVLAGWVLGAAWALLCWVIATWLQKRKTTLSNRPKTVLL